MPRSSSEAETRVEAVPLTILTGFLGAGKTTLLNRILTGDHGLRVAVLVNDFGSVNIDAELVVGVEEDMMSLANGCVCCEIRDDLVDAVDRLLAADVPPEFVVLEASGVADPAGIWATFNDAEYGERIRLDSVTCVVDAEQIFSHLDDAPDLLMLKARQIGFADLVVLNKVDLVDERHVAWVRGWIDEMMNRVRIVETVRCEVPYEILLGVGRFDPAEVARTRPDGAHDHSEHMPRDGFATWLYESDAPLDLEAIRNMISRKLSGSIYRCKGFVHASDDPETRFVLQTVGRRTEINPLDPWGDQPRRSRIVAIGSAETLDSEALQRAFDGCRS